MSTDRGNVLAVDTEGLTKRYGDTVAISNVSLSVPAGSVFGLVGPNGAGKTTLLSVLAGLRKPTSGSIRLGETRVGVLPDTPRFDGWLTGSEVIRLAAELAGADAGPEATAAVLATAGLTEAAHRATKGYSRGMLQRLGLAAAVVGDPGLLLLDEPAAALDPAGRREVLDLVSRLRGAATVVFSSHILDDVQEVCDSIGILRRGEMVYQGSLDGLLAGKIGLTYVVELRSGHAAVARSLRSQEWVRSLLESNGGRLIIEVRDGEAAERNLVPVLAASGHPVVSVTPQRTSLEQVFLEVTR
jgi:ABC-2 type transport system ATP-binding protein